MEIIRSVMSRIITINIDATGTLDASTAMSADCADGSNITINQTADGAICVKVVQAAPTAAPAAEPTAQTSDESPSDDQIIWQGIKGCSAAPTVEPQPAEPTAQAGPAGGRRPSLDQINQQGLRGRPAAASVWNRFFNNKEREFNGDYGDDDAFAAAIALSQLEAGQKIIVDGKLSDIEVD